MCEACERMARYMACDPEMYRGEKAECDRCRRIRELEEENARLRAQVAERQTE